MPRPVAPAARRSPPRRLSLALVLLVGAAAPLAAQERAEVTTRRAPRAEPDSVERQMRRLRQRADSLARLYTEHDELTGDERRRVGMELDRTVDEISQLAPRMDEMSTRVVRLLPQQTRATSTMAQAFGQAGAPRGWLGIVVTGAAREPWLEGGELLIRYLTHPEIVTVEPSSPAERAGLVPGDTLLAYDGRDVTKTDISLTRLLKPSARVAVRIRRDGRTRDVPVTIADRPQRIMVRTFEMSSDATGEGPIFPRSPFPPEAPRAPRASWSTSVGAALAPMPTVPAVPPMPPLPYGGLSNGVAGAQMASLTPGLARMTGVRRGVLVVSAPPGSPAAESGLKDADVIVKIGGREIGTVVQLREQLGAAVDAGARSVDIDYVREGRPRKATLRW